MPDLLTLASLLAIGLAAGFLAGLLGIGGGILIVPALVLLLGFDQHLAQGTSLVVIIPAALAGSWTHYRRGRLDLRVAAFVAVGGVLGAAIGSLSALSTRRCPAPAPLRGRAHRRRAADAHPAADEPPTEDALIGRVPEQD